MNLVKCRIDRAYKINWKYVNFCRELDRLGEYFCSNGYSLPTIESVICEKLNLLFQPRIVVFDVTKEKMFVKLPFMSEKANKLLSSDISKLFSTFYPQIYFRLIFRWVIFSISKIGYLSILKATLLIIIRVVSVWLFILAKAFVIFIHLFPNIRVYLLALVFLVLSPQK